MVGGRLEAGNICMYVYNMIVSIFTDHWSCAQGQCQPTLKSSRLSICHVASSCALSDASLSPACGILSGGGILERFQVPTSSKDSSFLMLETLCSCREATSASARDLGAWYTGVDALSYRMFFKMHIICICAYMCICWYIYCCRAGYSPHFNCNKDIPRTSN